MNRLVGWILVAAVAALGWRLYGWPGLVMAATVAVFWLLLQFNRTLRVMKNAGRSPVGMVPSAVMLNARLKPGMTMLEMLQVSKSLGRQLADPPDTWEWADEGGAKVTATLAGAKLQSWQLTRPDSPDDTEDAGAGPASP
jgi:hypothetical protein